MLRFLGAPLGSVSFVASFTDNQVAWRCDDMSRLAIIAETQPHATYCTFSWISFQVKLYLLFHL